MDQSQGRAHLDEEWLTRELERRDGPTLEELTHEPTLLGRLGEHGRRDADRRGEPVGGRLLATVDAEQVGVLTRNTHDHLVVTKVDHEVRVGDAAAERHDVECTCLLYTSDAADEEDSVDLGGR